MEEAGLQPHPEEDEDEPDSAAGAVAIAENDENYNAAGGRNETDNHVSKVPESSLIHSAILATNNGALSDQQSYQLYVQAAKPAGPDDLEEANVVKDGADNADDNSLLSHDQEDSESQDPLSRRRRVRIVFFFQTIFVFHIMSE